MARGLSFIMIWTVLMMICSSAVTSRRQPLLAAMFDVPFDHPTKDDYSFFKTPKTSKDNNVMLGLLNNWDDYRYVVPLLFARRQNIYPNVEVGPGAYKSEIIQYPSDTLKKQLSNLLKLKKKLEERRQT